MIKNVMAYKLNIIVKLQLPNHGTQFACYLFHG